MNTPLATHSGKSVKRLLRQAVRALRTDQFSNAIRFIDEVLERQPENVRANALKFTTYYMNQQLEKARLVGAKAAELNPKSEYILNNHACLQLGVGKAAEAKALLSSLVEQYGDNPQWLYNLGLSHAQLGEFDLAIHTFRRVLDIQPDYHKALLQLASVQLKLGLHEDVFQTLNMLRLVNPSQHTSSASHIYHALRFNQLDKESLSQEIAIWGDHFIPKNKAYENKSIAPNKALKLGFVIGSTLSFEWKTMVRPLINAIAKLGHEITVYWHQSGVLPVSTSKNIRIENCRSLSDADFARLCRNPQNDILIDVGGMHTQTRERAYGINLANKQYAWLVHAGIFSTDLIENLDEKLGSYTFAIQESTPSNNTKKTNTLPEKSIAAIGCEAGLSLKTVETWSKILHQSHLTLVLDVEREAIQQQLLKRFANFGISDTFLQFDAHIKTKPRDLVLDNLDYNAIGKATTALMDGATVITLKGELFPTTRTAALLEQTKNTQWIGKNEQDYVDLALKLIKTKKKNTRIKTQIKQSGVGDIDKFSQHFLSTLTAT